MEKIPDAIRQLIGGNALLQMGLNHRLFNLSQLSKYILPQIKARTRKDVQSSAILMSLSRLQRDLPASKLSADKFILKNLTVNGDLAVSTFTKTKPIHKAVSNLHAKIQDRDGFLTISEGSSQITLILEKKNLPILRSTVREAPIREYQDVASLALRFDESYLETPGFLYFVLQQLYLQNINIVELTSTATELIIYLGSKDVRLAFDTVYNRFSGR